jgi:hypothetical protein
MTDIWKVALSAGGGIVVALLSVSLGAILAGRSQHKHWARTAQIQYVTELLTAYSYVYNEFYKWAKSGNRPDTDWSVWNSALAKLSLTGDPILVQAALAIDRLFWATSDKFISGAISGRDWLTYRVILEESQVSLINQCRLKFGAFRAPIFSTVAQDVRANIEIFP